MDCHFQRFTGGQWNDAALLQVHRPALGGDSACTFEYDLDYVFSEAPAPVSLLFPVEARLHMLTHWPPFLFDLIPQGSGRKYLLGELGLPDDRTADFALLCAGAFNPIGRIRVREAVSYYNEHVGRHNAKAFAGGMTLDQLLARDQDFAERMLIHGMLAAGTTGVQGAAPKYLLTRDQRGMWHGDGALADEFAEKHFIVKLPRGKEAADKKVLRNEAAYMRAAKKLGLRVHGELDYHNDILFIPRFDREVVSGQVIRHHQESAASIAGIVGFDARPSQFDLLHALRAVVTDRQAETVEFLKRDVLNLALRNTDNHARNTAIQVVGNEIRLTPLFDFAPMYLDPEMIARVCRWYHPQTRKELTVWGDVIDAIDLEPTERAHIRAEMAAFAIALEEVSDVMRDVGVDDDIIEHLQAAISEQVRQLRDLANAPVTRG